MSLIANESMVVVLLLDKWDLQDDQKTLKKRSKNDIIKLRNGSNVVCGFELFFKLNSHEERKKNQFL